MRKCWFLALGLVWACQSEPKELPILGEKEVTAQGDTVYHSIPDFAFINQDGDTLTQDVVKDKIYISDFFFSTCPTICPIMKTQMLRVHDKFKDNPEVMILSHSINPRYDTPEVLKKYKEKLGVKSAQWQFLTGDLTNVYTLAQKSYLTSALEDSTAVEEGGFVHSGAFVLVDKNKHIRGIYDGTKEEQVDQLLRDMDKLVRSER